MDEKSTQEKDDGRELRDITYSKGASDKTLNFLRMFARTYQSRPLTLAAEDVGCMN